MSIESTNYIVATSQIRFNISKLNILCTISNSYWVNLGLGSQQTRSPIDLPEGSQDQDQARITAGYLAKYVGKALLDERRIEGLDRYDIAQGVKPIAHRIFALTRRYVITQGIGQIGAPYKYLWDSNDDEA